MFLILSWKIKNGNRFSVLFGWGLQQPLRCLGAVFLFYRCGALKSHPPCAIFNISHMNGPFCKEPLWHGVPSKLSYSKFKTFKSLFHYLRKLTRLYLVRFENRALGQSDWLINPSLLCAVSKGLF